MTREMRALAISYFKSILIGEEEQNGKTGMLTQVILMQLKRVMGEPLTKFVFAKT